MNRCQCPAPSRAPHTGDRERCVACGGWTPHGRPAPRGGLPAAIHEMRSFLDQIALDWGHVGDDPAPARRPDAGVGRGSGVGDPTFAAATTNRRGDIRDWVVLTARFIDRARTELARADAALGRALEVAEPRPPERGDHAWYPVTELTAEVRLAHEARDRRQSRGEL